MTKTKNYILKLKPFMMLANHLPEEKQLISMKVGNACYLKIRKESFWVLSFKDLVLMLLLLFFAGLIALSVNYILNPHTEKFTAKYVGGDGIMADKVELPDGTIVTVASNTTFFYDSDYGRKTVLFIWKEKPILM
jgi:hypothetical protein